MIQLHGGHELLRHLLDEALPVAVHIQDDPVFIEPASRLCDKEPYVGPILRPGLQSAGIAGICEVAIGVGVDVGEQHPQRGVVHFTLEVPLLAVCGGTQGALLIGAQGAGRAEVWYIHLLIKHIRKAHIIYDAAGGFVADGLAANLHVVRGLLRDGAGGTGQPRGREGGKR